ncbi:hypothetical protein JCGZ_07597 [Jatropha curcas]|uniref:YGGT family protein n=1 Tax=Jatropha curcas TaxID=180498 RepID=A0A067KCS5_JATCU|nr:ylmG homolog protein 2, chloroplastic [Jatropha curcas]KDP34026.1 hypothetical protein JCGZ_07597 [Jatropha curcas]
MVSSGENSKGAVPSFMPNCVLISSWVAQNPFLKPLKPNNLASPNCMIHELHTSLTSTADKCLRFLHLFASENPILKRIFSLPSDFSNHLAQIQCKNKCNGKSVSNHKFAAILPGDSVAGVVVANGILNFLNIYNTLLIVRLVLTWFPNSPPAIVSPLSTICDPYLNIFRGIIPPLGGTLDLSPILAFLVLNAFTSTAAALPAELPKTNASQGRCTPQTSFSNLTTSQKKWMRRLYGNKSHSSN